MNIEKVLDKPENKEKLLINRIEGYKKSDSSIVVNKVKELLDSIIYILSLHDEEDDIELMYEKGLEINIKYLKEAKLIYNRLLNNLLVNENRYYNSTIKDGFTAFFRLYDRYFEADNYIIIADYPLMITRFNLRGAQFIKNYLYCIETENSFLNRFDEKDIDRLLHNNNDDYLQIPVNLCETVFINWLFDFSNADKITESYKNRSENDLRELLFLKVSASPLSEREKIYFSYYLSCSNHKLYELIRLNKLNNIIYHEKSEKIELSFDDCARLSDERYKYLFKLISYERNYEALHEVDSIFDIADLLMEAVDEEEEMIKALAFVDEEKFIGLLLYYRNYESMFRDVLFQRLDGMDETKRNKIRKMLDNVKDGQDY